MELSHIIFFALLLLFFVSERLVELRTAKRNFCALLERGGREFGASHYPIIVAMHTAFFVSLVIEFIIRSAPLTSFFAFPLILLVAAQTLRIWVFGTMRNRWTTRVIVIPGEKLIRSGPFQFFAHPNYVAVAVELFVLPLIFGLFVTCIVFSLLNAIVLLFIRIPSERAALEWSQSATSFND
jgi:methyltransferase